MSTELVNVKITCFPFWCSGLKNMKGKRLALPDFPEKLEHHQLIKTSN